MSSVTLSPFMSSILGLELSASDNPGAEVTTEMFDTKGERHTIGCRANLGRAHGHRGAIVRTYTLNGRRTTLPLIQDQMEQA